jgi:hypothetical protein
VLLFYLKFRKVIFFDTGQIPESLGNCIKLERLNLSFNKLEGKCSIRLHLQPRIFITLCFFDRRITAFRHQNEDTRSPGFFEQQHWLHPANQNWRFRRHHRIGPFGLLSDRWGV